MAKRKAENGKLADLRRLGYSDAVIWEKIRGAFSLRHGSVAEGIASAYADLYDPKKDRKKRARA